MARWGEVGFGMVRMHMHKHKHRHKAQTADNSIQNMDKEQCKNPWLSCRLLIPGNNWIISLKGKKKWRFKIWNTGRTPLIGAQACSGAVRAMWVQASGGEGRGDNGASAPYKATGPSVSTPQNPWLLQNPEHFINSWHNADSFLHYLNFLMRHWDSIVTDLLCFGEMFQKAAGVRSFGV